MTISKHPVVKQALHDKILVVLKKYLYKAYINLSQMDSGMSPIKKKYLKKNAAHEAIFHLSPFLV